MARCNPCNYKEQNYLNNGNTNKKSNTNKRKRQQGGEDISKEKKKKISKNKEENNNNITTSQQHLYNNSATTFLQQHNNATTTQSQQQHHNNATQSPLLNKLVDLVNYSHFNTSTFNFTKSTLKQGASNTIVNVITESLNVCIKLFTKFDKALDSELCICIFLSYLKTQLWWISLPQVVYFTTNEHSMTKTINLYNLNKPQSQMAINQARCGIVFKYCGVNLDSYTFTSHKEVLSALIQICSTLDYLIYHHNFIHGDLAKRNILVERVNEIQILKVFGTEVSIATNILATIIDFGKSKLELIIDTSKQTIANTNKQVSTAEQTTLLWIVRQELHKVNLILNFRNVSCIRDITKVLLRQFIDCEEEIGVKVNIISKEEKLNMKNQKKGKKKIT